MKSSYFNTASKFENRVEKKWIEEKNQTLPDTDFESFFVETYDIVPQIPLQERGHLILQHLQSFVESKCNWSGGNEDEKEENKITKRERERENGEFERGERYAAWRTRICDVRARCGVNEIVQSGFATLWGRVTCWACEVE